MQTDDFDLDLTSVSSTSFEPVPAGTYRVVVEKFDPTAVSSKDNKMIVMQFGILEPERFTTRKIFHRAVITDRSLPFVKAALEGIFAREMGKVNFAALAEEAIGRTLSVRVTVTHSEGYSDQNQIVGWIPEGAVTKKAASAPPIPAGRPRAFDR